MGGLVRPFPAGRYRLGARNGATWEIRSHRHLRNGWTGGAFTGESLPRRAPPDCAPGNMLAIHHRGPVIPPTLTPEYSDLYRIFVPWLACAVSQAAE